MSWKLTEQEESLLTEEQLKLYEKAKLFLSDGWAGGSYGGWVRGYSILVEMGWKRSERTQGHRTFTSYTKPELPITLNG